MKQTIEFVQVRERRIPFDRQDAFQFRKDRPCLWLQRACLFVLRKLRTYSIGETLQIERHVIDPTSFIERIVRQIEEMEFYFNTRPSELLIGSEDYAAIMNEAAALQYFSFDAEYRYGRSVCGLAVKVIPWMRGCLVMPATPLDTRRAK